MTRKERVEQVLADVLARRASGEVVSDEQVLAEHADLLPELAEALSFAARMHGSRPKLPQIDSDALPAETLHLLSDDELNAPIELSADAGTEAANHEDPPPQVVGYTLLGEIARGGQAVVYKARQHSTEQLVAIKVLPGGRFASTHARARFDREAAILATLNHPDIVGIVDRGRTAEGFDYIVMPFIDGPTLDEFFSSEGRTLTLIEVVKLFAKLAHAVGDAHARDIVHRDLKPSNVRVDSHVHARVLDFGLARLLGGSTLHTVTELTMTTDKQIVGSLPYASPEQLRGNRELDASTDVYALGLMLYEAVTREPAYGRDVPMPELIANILHYEPRRPSRRVNRLPGVDGSLDAVLARCLAKKPEDRYPTATQLAADLDAVTEGHRVGDPPGRSRRIIIAAVLAAASIGFVVYQTQSSPLMRPTFKPVPLYPLVTLKSFTNSAQMKLLLIPSGESNMGINPFTPEWQNTPQMRTVRIQQAFWLGESEVTRSQYANVMAQPLAANDTTGDLPVTNVSWLDAEAFCDRLSAREKKNYRLPTVDEWEYASRAGQKTDVDRQASVLQKEAWYLANSGNRLHPGGQLRCSTWGLFDTLGNAAEWCETISGWDGTLRTAPVCGGSYATPASATQSFSRYMVAVNVKSPEIGFRVVAEER